MLAPPEMKKIHPLGKAPVVSVKTASMPTPMVIAESGTLVEYLCDHFAQQLVPTRYKEGKESQVGEETEEWMRYRYYMHYSEGSLMVILLLGLIVGSKFSETPLNGSPLIAAAFNNLSFFSY